MYVHDRYSFNMLVLVGHWKLHVTKPKCLPHDCMIELEGAKWLSGIARLPNTSQRVKDKLVAYPHVYRPLVFSDWINCTSVPEVKLSLLLAEGNNKRTTHRVLAVGYPNPNKSPYTNKMSLDTYSFFLCKTLNYFSIHLSSLCSPFARPGGDFADHGLQSLMKLMFLFVSQ